MIPTLTNPAGRNTKAHIVTDGHGNDYYFSYETCIAFRGNVKGDEDNAQPSYRTIRRSNDWGPTTGRHFNELGCKDFDMLTVEEFQATVERAC